MGKLIRPASLILLSIVPSSLSVSVQPQLHVGGEYSYFWPQARGRPEDYGVSPYTTPRNLTRETLAWSWFNGGPVEKYSKAAHSGLVIDGEKNLYLSSTDGIRKFTSDGELVWHHPMATWRIPCLWNGALYVTTNSGDLVALSMATGQTLWTKHFTKALGTDISGVAVRDGVVLAEAGGKPGGGAAQVAGIDAKDGQVLWEFNAHAQLWNFMPIDTGNGTFIFQDQLGGVYHLSIPDGKLLWKSGFSGSWAQDMTDGLPMVKDGVVYAVHSDGPCCGAHQTANLCAYDLQSGKLLWRQDFPYPANSQPVVGHLGQGTGVSQRLAVVMPIGAQPIPQQKSSIGSHYDSAIRAFDAKTGEPLWQWTPPTWLFPFVAGDWQRIQHHTLCLPNPYGSPSIDARGTVYLGHFNGMIYSIRDDNGDGTIQDEEVSKYNTGAGFSHGGVALAPGMLAVPSCDGLFVFKE